MTTTATCSKCGASTRLTERLASQLKGKGSCVACGGDLVFEGPGLLRPPMKPEKIKEAVSKGVAYGSSLQGPSGPRCTRCQKVIKDQDAPPGLCSISCLEAQDQGLSDAKLREAVFARDGGRCSSCGLDCVGLREELDAIRNALEPTKPGAVERENLWKARIHQLDRCGFDPHAVVTGAPLWQADHHPLPKVKGGPNKLEAVRTACLSCHKAATGALASSRAEARGRVKQKRKIGR